MFKSTLFIYEWIKQHKYNVDLEDSIITYTNMTPTVFANSEESLANSLQTLNPMFSKNGQVRQRDLVLPWLDQNLT